MRSFFLLCGSLFVALTGASLICRAIGHAEKSPAIKSNQAFFCGTSKPCWNSIYPGTTSLDEAKNILSETGFNFVEDSSYPLCWTKQGLGSVCLFQSLRNDKEPIVSVEIYPDDLSLGEAVLLFGSPVSARLCWIGIGLNPYTDARIYFSNDVFAYAQPSVPYSQAQRFQPDMVVSKIAFFHFPVPMHQTDRLPWRGFAYQSRIGDCGNPPEHQWY